MGKKELGMFKKTVLGVLVLLVLSSRALASDTLLKQKAIVIVSAMDYIAFNESDVETLVRYFNTILPDHKIIQIAQRTVFSKAIPLNSREVEKGFSEQVKEKITADYEITHLVIMDHGNSDTTSKPPITTFKNLGSFTEVGVSPKFRRIFEPLVGKFSDNAFIMMESCLTTCGPLANTQKRIKSIMDFFQIKSGTIFGAYKSMAPHGFESGYKREKIRENVLNPIYMMAAVVMGVVSQVDILANHADTLNLTAMGLATFGAYTSLQAYLYWAEGRDDRSDKLNWGYLFKFKESKIDKIFDLHPHRNQDQLFLSLRPKQVKTEFNACNSLFL